MYRRYIIYKIVFFIYSDTNDVIPAAADHKPFQHLNIARLMLMIIILIITIAMIIMIIMITAMIIMIILI